MPETKIEWADFVFNPWLGCQHVSEGCRNCYAETMLDHRYHKVKWGPHGERIRTSETYWKQPLRWARKQRDLMDDFEAGMITPRPPRPRVFCASLADVFDNQVPPQWRYELFDTIAWTPELDWLLLTKRPENVLGMLPADLDGRLPPNVWLGFTAEDQEHFDRRWPIVRDIPAAVRFCSYEPAIGPLRLPRDAADHLSWLICGGESGPGYRPMNPCWEASVRDDCGRMGIFYFFKQMSGKKPIPDDFPVVRQFPLR